MDEIRNVTYTVVSEKTLEELTTEIVIITKQTQSVILNSAIEIGRRLIEAKEKVPHGEWLDYLEKKVEFSISTANNFMRIAKEYGSGQTTFFGNVSSFDKLSYSKAVALFAVPEEERADFIEQNNVEEISVSELKKIIAQREEENKKLTDEKEQTEKVVETLRNELGNIADREPNEAELEKLRGKIQKEIEEKKAKEVATLKAEQDRLKKAIKDAGELEAKKIEQALVSERAKISALEQKLEEIEKTEKTGDLELAAAENRVKELEQKIKLADDDSLKFKIYFENLNITFNKLLSVLAETSQRDEEKGAKFKKALANALDLLKERV